MYLAELRARAGNPASVGLVGVGRMGRGIADQMATMTGLRVCAAADLDPDRARRAFEENGWEPDRICMTDDLATATDAMRGRRAAATRAPWLLPRLPVEAIVEATGDPTTGARVAAASIGEGHDTIMLTVEAAVVVGTLLAERARRRGVVYTLAAGDQPGAIFEMAEWARTLGFEIVCAGRGTVLFADDHHATPETYAEIAARNRMNPKMYNEFRDGTKSQLEMVAVSNVLRMPPARRGMYEPFCRWQDLGRVFAL